ncbi:MAG: hypothetical protein ACHRHE_12310 [Tepidisphaerales bacterium]
MTHAFVAVALQAAAQYHFRPFQTAAPVWDYWYLQVLPICAAIAVVYKCVRCREMSRVPREAAILTFFMSAVLVVVAIALAMLVWVTE